VEEELSREARRACQRALVAIQRRERSVAEIEAWLGERGFAADEIAAAVAELERVGELDDERFARLFAEDKRELSGWGPERVAGALAERGIDPALIGAVCGEGRESQLERASAQLRRRGEPLGGDRERSRALGYLTRRGFEYEVAYDAIRAYEGAG
jgi:regulatory protein